MELTAVESSHIEAIGYLKADRVLLVRFKTGALYARPCVDPHEYVELERAPSKGVWLKRYADMIRISSRREKEERASGPASSGDPPGSLNVIDPDAEKCCQKAAPKSQLWGMVDTPARWDCPECGTPFEIGMVGPNRHWRIFPVFAIARPR
jgi:hypothetical protein